MPKLNTLQASKTKRIIVYGPPKSGKTQLVGALAEKMNLVWFDFENGKDTLFKFPEEWKARIEMFSIPDSKVMPIGVETALKVVKGVAVTICQEHGKVNCPLCKTAGKPSDPVCLSDLNGKLDTCVVFDSLTQLTNSAIASITKNQPDDYKLDYDDWAHLGKVMDQFLSQLQAARYNVVVISHEMPIQMNDKSEKLVPVGGSRNYSRNVAKFFDDVIYCSVVNKAHKFASATTYMNNVLTGSRSGVVMEEKKDSKLLEMFV